MRKLKKMLKIVVGTLKLKKCTTDQGKMYFLCSRGIGDTVLFCTFLKAYRKKNNEKIIVLIAQESHRDIIEQFSPYYDETVFLNKRTIELFNIVELSKHPYRNDNFKYILPTAATTYLGYKRLSLLDLFRIVLEIGENEMPFIPDFSYKSRYVDEFINNNGLKEGKTLFLAPYAYSVSLFDDSVWESIINLAKVQGFKVITNIQKGECALEGTIPFEGTLAEACELVRFSGTAISNRSGLCDLLALCNVTLYVMYPNTESLKRYSFKNMKLKANIIEITSVEELNKSIEDHLCKQIIPKGGYL